MAFNEELAKRIRAQIQLFPEEFTEKRMFGGMAFLYKGKMTIGIVKNEIAVRVIGDKMESELSKKHVRPMDFTKRPMKEFIYVSPEGIKDEETLLHYVQLGLEHAKTKV